ncbi:hypothetical protein NEAUS03_0172 [Nematocida ausubeli]|nr:hypothetical protein NEAUS03_0172 [Nematocida ausubeli]
MKILIKTAIRAAVLMKVAKEAYATAYKPIITDKFNLLAHSDWMKVPSNVLFITYKKTPFSVVKLQEKDVNAMLQQESTEKLSLEAPGRSNIKYGQNVKSFKARIWNIFQKEAEHKTEPQELAELLHEVDQEQHNTHIDRLISHKISSNVHPHYKEYLLSKHSVVVSGKPVEIVTNINNSVKTVGDLIKIDLIKNENKNIEPENIVKSVNPLESIVKTDNVVKSVDNVINVTNIGDNAVKSGDKSVNNKNNNIEPENTPDQQEIIRNYIWVEQDALGTVHTTLVSQEEYTILSQNYTVKQQEKQVVYTNIYRLIISIYRILQSFIILPIVQCIYTILSHKLSLYNTSLTACTILNIPVISVVLPVISVLLNTINISRYIKGTILCILAVLSAHQVKYVVTNGSYSNQVLINWPVIYTVLYILSVYSISYGKRTEHEKMFPSSTKNRSIRTSVYGCCISILVLVFASLLVPYNKYTTGYITRLFYVVDARILLHIVQACIITLGYSASVVLMERIFSLESIQVVGALGGAVLLCCGISLGYTGIFSEMCALALVFVGFSMAYNEAVRVLPRDSVVRRHRKTVAGVILGVAVNVILALGVYVVLVRVLGEKQLVDFVHALVGKVHGLMGRVSGSFLGKACCQVREVAVAAASAVSNGLSRAAQNCTAFVQSLFLKAKSIRV